MKLAELRGLLIVGLGTAVVPLDASVNVAFPQIAAHFGLDIPAIRFVVISYVLIYASLTLAFGRIGDLLGYRRVFLLGCLVSLLAFVGCTLAPSFGWFLVGRAAQGVGAALILSVGPALATLALPEARRAQALGWYSMMMALAAAAGPLLAGVLLARWGWSSVYAFRIPIALAALLLAFTLPNRPSHPAHRTFDFLGAVLLALSIGALVLALDRLRGLPNGRLALAGATLLAALCLAGFIWRQRVAAAPIIALGIFRQSGVARINLANTLVNFGWFAVPLLLPFYLNRFSGLSVPVGGALLAVGPLGSIIAAPLAGRLAGRVSSHRLAQIGAGLVALALAAIGLVGVGAPILWLASATFTQGVGIGLFQVATLDILTSALPPEDRGVAGSLGMVTRTIGTLSGASLLMLAFQSADSFMPGFERAFALAAMLTAIGAMTLRPRRRQSINR